MQSQVVRVKVTSRIQRGKKIRVYKVGLPRDTVTRLSSARVALTRCDDLLRTMLQRQESCAAENKKCGYCGYILPQSFNLLDHSCFQPFNKDNDCINVDENLVVTVISRIEEFNEFTLPNKELNNSQEELNNSQEIDKDELLIYHVSQKRALFDHRIPANERSTLKKNALWQEICNSLGGIMSVTEIKKRWRYLRDCFLKVKKKEHTYIPSGSAAEALNSKKNSFRFYEQMKFLNDVMGKAPTSTSLPLSIQNDDDDENISVEARNSSMLVSPLTSSSVIASSSEESNFNSNRKRKADRSNKELNEEFHDTVINALRETKEPDGVDGFLLLLGEGLRKLPYRARTKLEMKFLAMLMEEQDKLHDLPI
ncbi:uncharacterized protein LOC105253706 isoform X2 [Camponotus floridanus]|nr:uncharacterized protein LOC105253706 isoform X2 [Camponotus floridanus]